MKKIFSVVLSVALLLSMSMISNASPSDPSLITKGFSTGGILGVQSLDGENAVTLFFMDQEESAPMLTQLVSAEYGSEVMAVLATEGEGGIQGFTLDMIRNIKVKAEWDEGGDLVESVWVTVIGVDKNNGERLYVPVIKIKLRDSESIEEADVIGTLTLNKIKGESKYRIKDAEVPVQFSVDHFQSYRNWLTEDLTIEEDTQFLSPGDPYLLKFDYDDDVEFSFGSEPNEGTFTVDVSGQGKLLLLYDTTPNTAVEAVNPSAKMVFFGFNNAKFNRTGEFFYETETGKYIYELIDGMPVEISNAVYDESDEGFRFRTNRLGRYVISDIPLVSPDPEAAKAATLSGTELYNPVSRKIILF